MTISNTTIATGAAVISAGVAILTLISRSRAIRDAEARFQRQLEAARASLERQLDAQWQITRHDRMCENFTSFMAIFGVDQTYISVAASNSERNWRAAPVSGNDDKKIEAVARVTSQLDEHDATRLVGLLRKYLYNGEFHKGSAGEALKLVNEMIELARPQSVPK